MDTRRKVRATEPKSNPSSKRSKSPVSDPSEVRVTRSKSPARVTRRASPARVGKVSDEPLKATRRRNARKGDDVSDSSSQSSTPKPSTPKLMLDKIKPSEENIKYLKSLTPTKRPPLDDSADSEVGKINSKKGKLESLISRLTPSKDSPSVADTPTPSRSRSVSVLNENEYSDEEEAEEFPIPTTKPVEELDECGGRIGSLVHLILVPLLPIALYYYAKVGKSFNWINVWEDLKNPYTYCNNQSGWLLTAFMSSTWLLTCVPVGRLVKTQTDDGPQNYKFTGFFTALITLAFLFGLEYYHLDVFSAIYNNIDRLLYMNIFNAILLAIFCYFKVKYTPAPLNPYGNTGKFLIDFFAGREVNPKVFKIFDIKAIVYHQAIVFILILNCVFIFKNLTFAELPAVEVVADEKVTIAEFIKQSYETGVFYFKNVEFNKVALLVATLQSVYALDSLIFEHHLTFSFELTQEGCGASLLLRYATFPFLLALLPKFLLDQQLTICCWTLCGTSVLFAVGLIIKRASSSLKYNYRLRPFDSKFKDLLTLPTFQSRRLILSSYWKYIRLPNYFGEILLHLALLLPLIHKFDIPSYVGILWIVVYVLHRIPRINNRNAKRYDSSWQRYISTVKYNILPKIY